MYSTATEHKHFNEIFLLPKKLKIHFNS